MKDSGAHSYENREERSELKILAWVNASTPSSSRGVCARDQIILFCATQKWLGNCDSDLIWDSKEQPNHPKIVFKCAWTSTMDAVEIYVIEACEAMRPGC